MNKFEKYYSWIKNNPTIERTRKMIYFTKDQYAITNSYSVILLNERPSGKYSDFETIGKFIDKFNVDKTDKIDIENIKGEGRNRFIIYDNEYSFKYSYFNNMKTIIKPNKIEVGSWGVNPILFLENTKTNEKGFLLPIKTY